MPPNNPLSYENLQALNLSKIRHVSGFLPLTHPDEEAQHQARQSAKAVEEEQVEQVVASNHKAAPVQVQVVQEPPVQAKKYSAQVQEILDAEQARNVLSCDVMVSNLVADSISRRHEEEVEAAPCQQQQVVEESYWDMPATTSTPTPVVQVEQQQQQVVAAADQEVVTAAHVDDATHPNHSYWEWDTNPTSPQETQAQLLQSILRSETIRQLLSTEQMTQVEEMNAALSSSKVGTPQVTHEHFSADHSDAYWKWVDESEQDQVVVASHVDDVSHPAHAYWDMPAGPTTPQETKQALIEQIVQEDKLRQMVSADFIHQTEVHAAATSESCSASNKVVESSSTKDNHEYWHHPTTISPSTQEELSKQDLIQHILQAEQNRSMVSTDAVVEQLVADSQVNANTNAVVANGDASGSYWDW